MEPNIVKTEEYLIIDRDIKCKNKYSEKMILNSEISGVIKPTIKYFNNLEYYSYNINDKKSLIQFYESKTISEDELINIFTELSSLKIKMAEYLLNYNHVLIKPEYIFYDITEGRLYFCLIPNAVESLLDAFTGFAMFLMEKIDEECELAVEMAYKYYENVINEVFDPASILEYEHENRKDRLQIEQEKPDELIENEKYYFIEPTNSDEEENENLLLKPLIVCAVTILIAGGLYTVVFLNPQILRVIGLSQENYFVIGSALAFFMSLVLFFIVKIYLKKAEKESEKKAEEEALLHKERMRAGIMEQAEYNMKNRK